jgi:hypothetical protein
MSCWLALAFGESEGQQRTGTALFKLRTAYSAFDRMLGTVGGSISRLA